MAATSNAERLRAIDTLKMASTGQAVPELAQIDRQATGWGCIVLAGLLGFGAFAIALLMLSGALIGWLALIVQLTALHLRQLVPQSAELWLSAMILATVLIVAFSSRWRGLMQDLALWKHAQTADAMGYIHLAVATLSRIGMTLFTASFLLFTLFAPVFALTQWRVLYSDAFAWLVSLMPSGWGFIAEWLPYALLVLAPFIFFNWSKRTIRMNSVGLFFILSGYLAIVWLLSESEISTVGFYGRTISSFWPLSSGTSIGSAAGVRGILGDLFLISTALIWEGVFRLLSIYYPVLLIAVFLVLGLAYPLGLSFGVARIFYLPYAIFRNTLGHIIERIQLRVRTSDALNSQLQQNRQRVTGDGWGTVCSVHLQRFVESRARRSYFRSAVYNLCPVCGRDSDTYNGVECICVLLDESMTDMAHQKMRTLYLNGLRWLDIDAQVVPAPFESLVIAQVDHFDIEQFVIHCHQKPDLQRALKSAPCYITSDHIVGDNTLGILRDSVARIGDGFVLTDEATPCRPRLRQREMSRRQLRQGLRFLLVLIVLIALYFGVRLLILFLNG